MQRRELLGWAAAASMLPAGTTAQTAAGGTLRLLVPFPQGGATDITARALTASLARLLGLPVVVENRPGAAGATCMQEVAAARPDGMTLGMATLSTHGVNPAVYKQLPYDALKGFTPVTEVVKAPGVLVVHPSVPAQDFGQFIRLLKAQPGKIAYASPGNGTIGHMWAELLQSTTGTSMAHVPYRGSAPALADLLAGKVQVYCDQVASSLPHIQSGKLRALAVSWKERLAVLPRVPTYAELSLFTNNDPSWFGLVGPAGMPAALARSRRDAVAQALQDPAVRQQLAEQGLFPAASMPDEFGHLIQKEVEKMRRVSRFARIELAAVP
ncbi:tripartite tricarboxylate transporter substrate binding protein BugE [Paracidovorax wautersii]|uniref:Tripartite-type tricarboxylate transporter receptor subunit TctC n=1 Tax=Paracidovorax wautersii TaxID=1177982 RepID=A0ABU1I9G8_9BURK|nr:tripartite tricarboxylate transporter substrate binding protein BugE [Paracidovorax wautersii]MDR6213867.1 tripartite-type tricarboxylate transporter receptor subunit TctC [Paracidovorax wautersii]